MAIELQCPLCMKEFRLKDDIAGKKFRCSGCREVIEVPAKKKATTRSAAPRKRQTPELDDVEFIDDDDPFEADEHRAGQRGPDSNPWIGAAIGGGIALVLAVIVLMVLRSGPTDTPTNNPNAVANAPTPSPAPTPVVANPNVVANPAPVTVIAPSLAMPAVNKAASNLFPIANVPVPNFPASATRRLAKNRVSFVHKIDLATVPGQIDVAGSRMKMILYLPQAQQRVMPRLSCVIVASAGTNFLRGNECPSEDYEQEMLPYLLRGHAVLGISLDGEVKDMKTATPAEAVAAYHKFRAAHAGLVNVRNGIEYLKRNVPDVNPRAIYVAGHSSAGTVALLAAAHFPELAGCMVYAPACDLLNHMTEVLAVPEVSEFLPDVRAFVVQQSPLTHAASIRIPVHLFHSSADTVTRPRQCQIFLEALRASGNNSATITTVPSGDHYNSMIDPGMQIGSVWITAQERLLTGMPPSADSTPSNVTPSQPMTFPTPPQLPPKIDTSRPRTVFAVTLTNVQFNRAGDVASVAQNALRGLPFVDINTVKYNAERKEPSFMLNSSVVSMMSIEDTLRAHGIRSTGVALQPTVVR